MDFREKRLYHQIHPLKLATDIGVTPLSLYFVWEHRVAPAMLVGFLPPILVSLVILVVAWCNGLIWEVFRRDGP